MPTPQIAYQSYLSSPRSPKLWDFLGPSIRFYPPLLKIVFKAALAAKMGRYRQQEWIQSSLDVFDLLERVGVRFEIQGTEALAGFAYPCVFIANHMSTLETFILPSLLCPHTRLTFVVKRALVNYPVFKHVMKSRHPVVVDRKDPRADLKAVLEGGQSRLEQGLSIVVFPQSTRSRCLDPHSFNSIGVKLARRAGVPIVPVAIKSDAWGSGRLVKDFGPLDPKKRVHFCFGSQTQVQGPGKEEHRQVLDFIRERLQAWEQQA